MRIICTVINDLTYDQRMHRICTALVEVGHRVTLVGRMLPASKPLPERPFLQVRLHCGVQKGALFYALYNLRLFFFLLTARYDAICSVDFDSLPAGCLVSVLRRKKRVFDAHEFFTEVPEVTNRPVVKATWDWIGRICLPFYHRAYTVGPALAALMGARYGLSFGVVRNVPVVRPVAPKPEGQLKIVLYQGALNEGRGIEAALEAMTLLPEEVVLWLAGEGDRSEVLRQLAFQLGLGERVRFLGYVLPDDLPDLTAKCWIGLNLLENKGLSYYYSLANKFFDYVQAEKPVLAMRFPEYEALNQQHQVALLLDNLSATTVAEAIQRLANDNGLYTHLSKGCAAARLTWVWEQEKETLLRLWAF
jgi:glycosyltransferase involved in cell wall biosynthesis